MDLLGFLKYIRSYYPLIKIVFFLSFRCRWLSFSCLARTPEQSSIKVLKSDTLVLFLFLGQSSSLSVPSMVLAVGLPKCPLLNWELSFIPSLLNAFMIKGCRILSMAFSASIQIITWSSSFSLLIRCSTFTDFQMLQRSRIPGWTLTWSWRVNLFIRCWIEFASIAAPWIKSLCLTSFCYNVDEEKRILCRATVCVESAHSFQIYIDFLRGL